MSEKFVDLGVVAMEPVQQTHTTDVESEKKSKKKAEKVTDADAILGYWQLYPDAKAPAFATERSGCFDISCFLNSAYIQEVSGFNARNEPIRRPVRDNTVSLHPGDRVLIPTGFVFDIPDDFDFLMLPRSSTGLKRGLDFPHSLGFIDSDYVEESFILVRNMSDARVQLSHRDTIAQGLLIRKNKVQFKNLSSRPKQKTSRAGGFGHTDNKRG